MIFTQEGVSWCEVSGQTTTDHLITIMLLILPYGLYKWHKL